MMMTLTHQIIVWAYIVVTSIFLFNSSHKVCPISIIGSDSYFLKFSYTYLAYFFISPTYLCHFSIYLFITLLAFLYFTSVVQGEGLILWCTCCLDYRVDWGKRMYNVRWFGHVHRKTLTPPIKRTKCIIVKGRRSRGRPRKMWRNKLKMTCMTYTSLRI